HAYRRVQHRVIQRARNAAEEQRDTVFRIRYRIRSDFWRRTDMFNKPCGTRNATWPDEARERCHVHAVSDANEYCQPGDTCRCAAKECEHLPQPAGAVSCSPQSPPALIDQSSIGYLGGTHRLARA